MHAPQIFAIIALVAFVFFLLVGLLNGLLVLVILRKKRHLFWALPLINILVFHLLPYASEDIAQLSAADGPSVELIILAYLLLTIVGWISAVLLAPVQLFFRMLLSSREKQAEDTGQPAADCVDTEPVFDLDRPPAASLWGALREGFAAPGNGFRYLCANRRLWRHAIAPIVMNIVLSTIALLVFIALAIWAGTHIHAMFPEGWGWMLLEILCGLMLLLVALAATFAMWLLLQEILCGHYYEKLAREVELQLGVEADELGDVSLRRQIADTAADLATLAAVNVGLLLLNVIPVLGTLAAIAGGLYFNCFAFGTEYLSFPLQLRRYDRKRCRKFARDFRGQTLGLGAVVLVLGLVPVVGAIVLATAVVGAVLLHRRLRTAVTVGSSLPPG